jgi:hypothetical protein
MPQFRVEVREVWKRTVLVEAKDADTAAINAQAACDTQKFDDVTVKVLDTRLMWAEDPSEIDMGKVVEIPVVDGINK